MSPDPVPSAQPEQFLLDLPAGDASALKAELFRRLAARLVPESPCEVLRIEEMATAWLEVSSLRGQVAAMRQFLQAQAAERFEEKTRLHYQKLDKALLKSHGANFEPLAAHTFGADLLARRWRELYLHVAEQKPVEIHQICSVLVAEGCSDLMQEMDRRAVWLVSRLMRRYNNPEYLAQEWADYSRVKPDQAMALMDRLIDEVDKLPGIDETFSELLDHTYEKQQFWTNRSKAMEAEFQSQKAAFCQGFISFPGAVPSIRSLIGLERLQITRISQLEREFRQLQRERLRDVQTALQQAARLQAILNGTVVPGERRAKTALTPTVPEQQGYIPTNDQLNSPTDNSTILIHEPAAAPEAFPEMELIQAVRETVLDDAASNFNPSVSSDHAQHTGGPVSPRLQETRELISRLTGAELANPMRHPSFKRLFNQANHLRRKDMLVMVNDEKLRRARLPALQPSG